MRIPRPLKLLVLLVLIHFVVQAKMVLLNDTDGNSHICLYVGDVVTIKLVSNPTTGYSWGKPEPMTSLKLVSSRIEPGSSERAGALDYQVFTFRAAELRESTIVSNYLRPFERNTPPAKSFHVSVTVEARPAKAEASAKP